MLVLRLKDEQPGLTGLQMHYVCLQKARYFERCKRKRQQATI
jgi:hypothetical protein